MADLHVEDDVSSNEGSPIAVPKKRGHSGETTLTKSKIANAGRPRGRLSTKNDDNANGDTEENGVPKKGRGRPPKGSKKKASPVIATGKGRGRPKREKVVDNVEDDDDADDDYDNKQSKKAKTGKSPGRPKKVKGSDDESSDDKVDDYEVKRTVGRPSSGGVNLNIVATGRGQGRPKKKAVAPKTAGVPGKRGRPSKGLVPKSPYKPTGKARGRPKTVKADVEEDEQEDDHVDSKDDDEDAEDGEKEDDGPLDKDDEEVDDVESLSE